MSSRDAAAAAVSKHSKKSKHREAETSSDSDSDAEEHKRSKKASKRKRDKKDKKKKKGDKKSKRHASDSESSSDSGSSGSESESESTHKKKAKTDNSSSKADEAAAYKQKQIDQAREAVEAMKEAMEEDEKKEQVVLYDEKVAAVQKLMQDYGKAKDEDKFKMIVSMMQQPAQPDLKAAAAAVGPPQFPVRGKSNEMKQWFQVAEEKWALMKKGEEVLVTCPEMASMLYDRRMRNNIHWTNFMDVEKMVSIWIKSGGKYATFQTTYDKMQSFGGKKYEWPHTFVMKGPLMRCEFPRLGIEGNYDRLGKEYGPKTIYDLNYQVSCTNEIFSEEMCDENRRAFIVSEFFDMLDRLQTFCNRKVGSKGGFKEIENLVSDQCEAANKKIDEENEKRGTKVPHETLPQTKADWITFIERHAMNPATTTDTNKGVRKTGFSLAVSKKFRKQRKDPLKAHVDDVIIGKDAHYVPIDSPNKVFIKLFNAKEPENHKDMQRKRDTYRMLLPIRPDEVKLAKGEPLPPNPWPYREVDFTTIETTQGDVLQPTFALEFYPNIAGKTGLKKKIIDIVWNGRVGQLNDNPPTACNPLLAVPMATVYTPPPKRGDDDEDDEDATHDMPVAEEEEKKESSKSKKHKKHHDKEKSKKHKEAAPADESEAAAASSSEAIPGLE
jgi:hypothetical protein